MVKIKNMENILNDLEKVRLYLFQKGVKGDVDAVKNRLVLEIQIEKLKQLSIGLKNSDITDHLTEEVCDNLFR